MHRNALLQMLDRYLVCYPNETDMAARIRSLTEQHDNCFERSCLPGHLTGSAWVVSADHQRVVLVHHRKLQRWLQPGGHADGDSDLAAVARKEAVEETGLTELTLIGPHRNSNVAGPLPLDIDVHVIPARYGSAGQVTEPTHDHHDLRFLFVASEQQSSDAALTVSHESHAVRWFDEGALRSTTDEPSLLRMLAKATDRLKR